MSILLNDRDEVQPQLLEAAVNNLSHPNFDSSLCKKIIFVTTGIIKPPATLAFQEFNNFIQTKYKLDPILSVEKLDLVEDFVRYGIEPFFALHNDPTFVGDFFDLYWCAKNIEPLEEIIKRLKVQYPSVAHDYHHILKSLVYFEDAESDPEPEIYFPADWKKVKKFFIKEIPLIATKIMK